MSDNTASSAAEATEKRPKREEAIQWERSTGDSHISAELADSPYFIHDGDEKPKKKGLPEWLDHFNVKDLKTLFKCSVAVWIATLFLLINPTLVAFGQATFFGCIVLFILPCNGVVFIQVLGGLTMIVGMAAGWAWGVISMKAALAARPAAETNARLAQLASEATRQQTNTQQATGQSMYTQVLIFEGFMLDTRVTVTYFCMVGLFVYLVARLRVRAPKLALFQMFAIIISDIFLTIGPLIPTFTGTIPSVLIKPAAAAIGIGMACNILLFPRSTSHIVIDTMQGALAPMKGVFSACKLAFRYSDATVNLAQLQKTKATTIAAYKEVEANLGFLALDLSTGRWSTEDVKSLHEPLRQVVIMCTGLLELQIFRVKSRTKYEKLNVLSKAIHGGTTETEMPEIGHHHLLRVMSLRDRFQHPDTEDLLNKSMGVLFASSGPLLDTCGDAVDAILGALQTVNSRRWVKKPGVDECDMLRLEHEQVLKRLKEDQQRFQTLISELLLEPHNHLFDEHGVLKTPGNAGAPVHGLALGFIFEERILSVASALDAMLTRVIRLEQERTKTKIWLPKGLRDLLSWGLGRDAAPGVIAMSSDNNDLGLEKAMTRSKTNSSTKKKKKNEEEKETGAQAQLDKLRFRGGTKRSTPGKILLAVSRWLGNTEGLYALRALVLTIALALPAVLTSSAGFYYREKGMWALIMAQTGLMTYTAEFVYGFVLRTLGTVVGGILGMVCWYIGAGNGPGNPYGMAAIMALAVVMLMWGRLFAPPAFLQGVLLMASTLYLVVAYSWVDTHIPSYGNPGVGYTVFWRRVLLVMIGFTASAIVIFIPRPPSASRHCRRVLASTIRDSKDLYALYVMSWTHKHSDLEETSEKQILASVETLGGIAGPLALLRFEFSSSNFDAETLSHVANICMDINQSLSQLILFSNQLRQDYKERFAKVTGALDESLIGDLMAVLTLVEQSLETGSPLPAVLPVPLIARSAGLSEAFARDKAGQLTLSIDAIKDEGFRKYCVVLSAFVQLLSAVDDLVWRVKTAVGETSYVDVEQPFLSRHVSP
ncbi:hypothetical protein Z517_07494 [Fonsecaea pedrosoi CBS 271.37]|uniref:Unplaced genomic scaffold supercont1.5, whole genome shotgun sequence n=1 Tax=Fonsecaea pedrosoi CBS 271.37 TaxID=1442368 RepID=A0A0D2ETV4_9EURO|nr:uncharacterized protein Z517_07494 [Fonsecaea pedrosoi CBS 271.37]KIW77662.1 hypothetical protein Z517_07494 [Fonsecaea pedrosoi CBS 271.37]